MASINACEKSPPPQLLLVATILTPSSFIVLTYSKQAMAPSVVPCPLASKNLQDISLTFQLTPTTPTLLFPTAPIVPPTCVPWPLSSIGSESLLATSIPLQASTKPLPSLSIPSLLQSAVLRNILPARS